MRRKLCSAFVAGSLLFCHSVLAGDYAWWPLNDGAGSVAQNLVAGGTDGDIIDHDIAGLGDGGSVWVNDPERGMVLGLNGSTGWVDAGVLPQMTFENSFSWSFWAKQSSAQPINNDIIIGNRYGADGVDTAPREFIKFTPRQYEFHMNGAAAGNLAYSPFNQVDPEIADIPSNDEWIHHAVVKQGDTLIYFRNGEFSNTGTLPTGQASPDPLPFALGGQGVENWRGYLSDVQLYSDALDLSGIESVMAGQLAAGSDLYARWQLNEGSGDTASDQGPNGFDGDIFDWDIDGLAADGSVWVDDPDRGTVLGLGGNTAWVSAGELPIMDLETDFTWTFWARQDPDQPSPANDIVIGNRYADEFSTDTAPREFIKFTPDRFEFHMEGAGAGDLQYAGAEQWVHHIVVKDGEDVAYYRDGVLENEGFLLEEQLSADPLPFAMGGQNGAETWAGYLSEVRLFDHALNDVEIAELSGGTPQITGDFNRNGVLDVGDIDMLTVASAQGDASFDLTGDGITNSADVSFWAIDLKNTWIGDANVDGEFNSSDFVAVFTAGLFETNQSAVWSTGDWNGDGLFNSSDFVAAFTDGGFEIGPRSGVAAVPEPSSLVLLMLGSLSVLRVRRKTN